MKKIALQSTTATFSERIVNSTSLITSWWMDGSSHQHPNFKVKQTVDGCDDHLPSEVELFHDKLFILVVWRF